MEGREWLRRALAMGGDTAPAARAMALVKLTILEGALGGTPAPELAAEAVALRRALGDERGVASALNVLAGVLERRFEHDRAGQLRAEATAIRERLGDLNGLAHSRSGFARIALEHGDVDRAEILYTEALDLFRRDGFPYGIASVLLALGGIEADRGNTAGAAVRYAESLRLCGEIRSQALLVDALAATGRLAAMAGWAEAAARVLGAAAALGEALGCVSPPKEQAWRQSASSAACATLGEHACTAARAAGRTLSPERAVADAAAVLTVVSSLPPPARSHRAGAILFTSREQDVLRLLVEGSSDREIAEALGLSYRTVTSHVRNILGKLDVASRTAAATQAVRRGLV
jgi:DNA-binding CsgD family transcriptional regulator